VQIIGDLKIEIHSVGHGVQQPIGGELKLNDLPVGLHGKQELAGHISHCYYSKIRRIAITQEWCMELYMYILNSIYERRGSQHAK